VIFGKVSDREAVIRIGLAGGRDGVAVLDAVIDTGFTDYLTISKELVDRFDLRFRECMEYELANGELGMFDLYEARVDGTVVGERFWFRFWKEDHSSGWLCLRVTIWPSM